jgi:alcohol dehydrogenase class IV
MTSTEQIEQFFPGVEYPIISYGLPFPQACAKHVKETLGCSKVYVICSGTLSRTTDIFERLEAALGEGRLVGVRKGMKPHTMFSELLEVAADVEKSGADCITTVGGGSLVDAAKYIPFVRSLLPQQSSPSKHVHLYLRSHVNRVSSAELTPLEGHLQQNTHPRRLCSAHEA